MNDKDNFLIVIRSAAERTADICKYLITKQVPEELIYQVEAKPFEAALKQTYELGIKSKKKWLVTLDADVLVSAGAINDILGRAEKLPQKVFHLEGYLFDGILLNYRTGGVKLYRAEFLEQALTLLPQAGKKIRPESYTLSKMQECGYPRKIEYFVTGLHDYEQYYCDLYRKAYIHSKKHPEKVSNLIYKWAELAQTDENFKVILKGVFDSIINNDKVMLDTRYFDKKSTNALLDLNLKEKDKINNFSGFEKKVQSIINEKEPLFPPMSFKKIQYKLKNEGFYGTIRYLLYVMFREITLKLT